MDYMIQARRSRGWLAILRESEFWRAGPLGALLDAVPGGLRLWLRRILKAIYWAVTPHRMGHRIAFLQAQRRLALAYAGGARRDAAPPAEDLAVAKARFRARSQRELNAFLDGPERLALPASPAPEVSVILILYNQAELTFRCLKSLTRPEVATEVIILDNGSSDRTGELLDRLDGARIVRSAENLHFLRGVNRAVQEAKGQALLLLNNDTALDPGSIGAAWRRLAEAPDVGAVGGRIVLPNGVLQEAGSIVWRDGSCVGYGRDRSPDDAEFAFRRDVDYCSGAFLMVRKSAFDALGGLDEAFAPAYYEETDLCMRLWAAGLRVVYEPAVRLTHFEFGSSGLTSAVALQERNRALFVERHAAALAAAHHRLGTAPLEARMRERGRGRVLVIDDRAPVASLGSGLPRAASILEALSAAGWFVTHYPLQFPEPDPAAAAAFPGVEIAYGHGVVGLPAFLRERVGYYDAVLVSRPHNMETYRRALAVVPEFGKRPGLIYDAEAIFANREALRRRVLGEPADEGRDRQEVERELGLAAGADVVLSVSEGEAATYRAAGAREVRVLGHAVEPRPTEAGFEARAGLLFVGALDQPGSPNVDSLVWFVREVAPRLDVRLGEGWSLAVAGRNDAPEVQALAGPRVRLLGRVEDLRPLYGSARALIAPTRFAAGLPMKVHEAAGAGLPAVVTGLVAEQTGWPAGEALLRADGAEAFAEACAAVLTDAGLWGRLREGAIEHLRRDCDPAGFQAAVAAVLQRFEGRHGRVAPVIASQRSEAGRERVKQTWAMSPEQREQAYGMSWMAHPMVVRRLNAKASGAPEGDAYTHLMALLQAQGWRFPVPRALSLGCGHGALERGLAGLGFAERIDGVDLAPGAVAEARRLAAEAGLTQLHYHVGDLEQANLPEGGVDVVLAHQSVHHIEHLDALFEAVRWTLRPGGVLHLHEFVGPDRFQWTEAQLHHINAFVQALPPRYRRLPSGGLRPPRLRPTIPQMIASDPSEAVRSSEILAAVRRRFRIVELRELGGALLHVGLSDIAQNFDPDAPEDVERLEQFFALEDRLMAEGVLTSDFVTVTAVRD